MVRVDSLVVPLPVDLPAPLHTLVAAVPVVLAAPSSNQSLVVPVERVARVVPGTTIRIRRLPLGTIVRAVAGVVVVGLVESA
jgi:hypothetical protein